MLVFSLTHSLWFFYTEDGGYFVLRCIFFKNPDLIRVTGYIIIMAVSIIHSSDFLAAPGDVLVLY